MNYLDVIIAVPVIYGFIKGFENGLIKEVTGLLGLVFGLYVAANFSSYLQPQLTNLFAMPHQFIPIISFATLFIVSVIGIKMIGYLIDKFTKALALGFISRVLGSFFGVLKIIVVFSLLLLVSSKYNLIDKSVKKESTLIIPLELVSEIIIPELKELEKNNLLEKAKKRTKEVKENIDANINSELQ